MKKIFALMLSFTFIYACHKDEFIEPNPADNPLTIGNGANINLTSYDSALEGGYYHPKYFEIDLDNDQISDIQFQSVVQGSPAVGQLRYMYVKCLNPSVELHGFMKKDTVFSNTKITYTPLGNKVNIDITHYESCRRENANDTISLQPEKFVLSMLQKDGIIKKEDVFQTGTITLIGPTHSSTGKITNIYGDTTEYTFEDKYFGCDNFPEDTDIYLGFKITTGNKQKMGWFKISCSFTTLTISEVAIQR